MPLLGKKIAGDLVDGLHAQVAKAMDEVRLDIAAATTELVEEIRGGHSVAKAVRAEAMAVGQKWTEVMGNAERATDESISEAAKVAEVAKTANGQGAGS